MIKEFKHLSDQQRQEEKKIHDFQVPEDDQKQMCNKQPSLSDIDFNPQQKLMNNFFSSTRNDDLEQQNNISENKNSSSSGDANKAVIMITGESKAPETDRETALGDLAQQLNDTSFFAGNNGNASIL